jgi:hypothetical protein
MKPAPANSLTKTEPGLLFPAAAEQEECALLPASTHTTAATYKHEVLVRPGSRLVLVLVLVLLIIILRITPIQQTTRKKGFHKMKPRIECNSIFQTNQKKKLSRYESGYLPKDWHPDSPLSTWAVVAGTRGAWLLPLLSVTHTSEEYIQRRGMDIRRAHFGRQPGLSAGDPPN